jgi:2-polyprenyl-3-methyl-5-hydroxy-6-metoxy-1,4-benzoquinol methylase
MHALAWTQYDARSMHFFETYESLEFQSMHKAFLRFLPREGARCLDVGAGSGRDAAAMARLGYRVTAVEPSAGLRKLAERHHDGLSIDWIDDSLPELNAVKARGLKYAFILLSAVWMHIYPEGRHKSLETLAELLEPEGYLAMTLRLGTPDTERTMFPVSSSELVRQAAVLGLKPRYVGRPTRDSLHRGDVQWVKVVLSRA